MSIALESVSRVVVRERMSIANRLVAAPSASDITIFWPSGEKRGAKVMPGKLPTTSRWPVSMLSSSTFGSVGPNDI